MNNGAIKSMKNNAQPRFQAQLIQRGLILVLICLAIATVYQVYIRHQPAYQVHVFKTTGGWGYDILTNKKTIIHQPTIPGQSGIVGFANEAQARRVGEWVVNKMEQTKALPTLTNDDLRQLGVNIP